MQFIASLRIVGVLLMCLSLSYLPPIAVSLWYQDNTSPVFLAALVLTLFVGVIIYLGTTHATHELRTRDGFLVVVLAWTILSAFACLPFIIADDLNLSFTDAFFETASGLTTTGATVITGLDRLPRAILYYRQQLQFFRRYGNYCVGRGYFADARDRGPAIVSR